MLPTFPWDVNTDRIVSSGPELFYVGNVVPGNAFCFLTKQVQPFILMVEQEFAGVVANDWLQLVYNRFMPMTVAASWYGVESVATRGAFHDGGVYLCRT